MRDYLEVFAVRWPPSEIRLQRLADLNILIRKKGDRGTD